MSEVILSPSRLHGTVQVPPSKSAAHRAILCAALSRGTCRIQNIILSDDMRATIGAIRAMGVSARLEDKTLFLDATKGFSPHAEINCLESGSTLRFLIPILGALGISSRLTGCGRLPQRPIGVYLDCLPPHGLSCLTEGGLPLALSGRLQAGEYRLPGNISSQFITGLLLALPLLPQDSQLTLSSPLESSGYVDMTLSIMRDFGVNIHSTADGWHIPGGQCYTPRSYEIEGDWSQAAFFLAAGTLGGSVAIQGLRPDSCQGDRAALHCFREFGAQIAWENGLLTANAGDLHGIEIDAAQIPDLVPILASTAALSAGTTRIFHAERLRIKESDRLAAMCDGLNRLGGKATETEDGLSITGVPRLTGGRANGYNDHRIVMALSIAALCANAQVTLTDAQSIQKSYPQFFDDYQMLGGVANVL